MDCTSAYWTYLEAIERESAAMTAVEKANQELVRLGIGALAGKAGTHRVRKYIQKSVKRSNTADYEIVFRKKAKSKLPLAIWLLSSGGHVWQSTCFWTIALPVAVIGLPCS